MTYSFNAKKLIELRQENFWTQEDLAAASGLSPRTIQRMETRGRGSVDSWKAVASAFNITPNDLLIPSLDLIEELSRHEAEIRRAVIGAILCCAAGLVGCSLGWWLIFSGPTDFHEAVTDYAPLSAYVTLATAICLIVPIMTWKRTIKA